MSIPRIFVSYDINAKDKQIAANLVSYLKEDFDVKVSDSNVSPAGSQWVVLVRTPEALRQNSNAFIEVQNALNAYSAGQLQGVLAVATTSVDEDLSDIPPLLSTIATYDVGVNGSDQQRAFENVKRTIGYTTKPISSPASAPAPMLVPVGSQPQSSSNVGKQNTAVGQTGGPNPGTVPNHQRSSSSRWLTPIVIAVSILLLGTVLASGILLSSKVANNSGTPTPAHGSTPTSAPVASPSAPSGTATLTHQQAQNLYNSSMKSQYLDNLHLNDIQVTNNGTCAFNQGTYTITTTMFQPCMAAAKKSYKDFAFEVKMTINSGVGGGLIFRSDSLTQKFYRFSLDSVKMYHLFLCNPCVNPDASDSTPLTDGNNPSNISSEISEKLTVIVKGSLIYLYLNDTYVAQVKDALLSSGEIGLFAAGSNSTQSTVVKFSELNVWKL